MAEVPINDILKLAQRLIAVPSVTGDIDNALKAIALIKGELPGLQFTPFASNGFPSLLYSNTPNTKEFKIIFNVHLDVVPGTPQQFQPYIEEGTLYGRGAYDMKAAAAVMITIFRQLAYEVTYPFGLQITADEELGGMDGTKHQLDNGIRADFVITGESGSNFGIVNESKARLVVRLVANGKTSHSAYPWLGDNAILRIQSALNELLKHFPVPEDPSYVTTVNITHINTNNVERSNTAYNRTPHFCEALLDIRYIPADQDTIIQKVTSLVSQYVEVEILHNTIPHQTSPNNAYILELQRIGKKILARDLPLIQQHATSDARHFSYVGCDGVEFGPVGAHQHTDNEQVNIKSLENYYKILHAFLKSLVN